MADSETHIWNTQDAMVGMMVAASISDEEIKTIELLSIERIVNHLPLFADYNSDRMRPVAQTVYDLFEEEEGLDAFFGLVKDAIPERLYETAYALCCDLVAADGRLRDEELRFLQETRYELNISRLNTAAIERGARARHMVL